jgi:hypothetical protein
VQEKGRKITEIFPWVSDEGKGVKRYKSPPTYTVAVSSHVDFKVAPSLREA